MESFTDQAVRIGFIRKVYGIVSVQVDNKFSFANALLFSVSSSSLSPSLCSPSSCSMWRVQCAPIRTQDGE